MILIFLLPAIFTRKVSEEDMQKINEIAKGIRSENTSKYTSNRKNYEVNSNFLKVSTSKENANEIEENKNQEKRKEPEI